MVEHPGFRAWKIAVFKSCPVRDAKVAQRVFRHLEEHQLRLDVGGSIPSLRTKRGSIDG